MGEYSTSSWRILQIFNGYRLGLALFLLGLYSFDVSSLHLGEDYPRLFSIAIGCYVLLAMLAMLLTYQRVGLFRIQATLLCWLDIIMLLLMIHASGGIISGLGILINIVIAGASLLLVGKLPWVLAAIASLILLFEHSVYSFVGTYQAAGYLHIGILGASFFATALVSLFLVKRVQASQALASKQAEHLEDLQYLNATIIQHLPFGIIVLDSASKVRLINDIARQLLNMIVSHPKSSVMHQPQIELPVRLKKLLHAWYESRQSAMQPLVVPNRDELLLVKFTALNQQQPPAVLIFVDDSSRLAQQAQQMKLVSLGRFTASIAHELRNPLGAIGHAIQLLQESNHLDQQERRLTDIIWQHVNRMNAVVKNVLQLSRREKTCPDKIMLKPWLEHFITEFTNHQQESLDISLEVLPDNINLCFDSSQLCQVLTNLCENGLRYSKTHSGRAWLTVRAGLLQQKPYIDIIDCGPGISTDKQALIFEPFYTSERVGTGLGLYIAKELCEANQARLELIASSNGHNVATMGKGAQFRIWAQPV
ncbi:MAG: two-component system sensor histidine kinase PilS [Gammaproteobacteria bacterium]